MARTSAGLALRITDKKKRGAVSAYSIFRDEFEKSFSMYTFDSKKVAKGVWREMSPSDKAPFKEAASKRRAVIEAQGSKLMTELAYREHRQFLYRKSIKNKVPAADHSSFQRETPRQGFRRLTVDPAGFMNKVNIGALVWKSMLLVVVIPFLIWLYQNTRHGLKKVSHFFWTTMEKWLPELCKGGPIPDSSSELSEERIAEILQKRIPNGGATTTSTTTA